MTISLGELASRLKCELRGDAAIEIQRVASLEHADAHSLSFLTNPAHKKYLSVTSAGAVILQEKHADAASVPVLISDNPYADYARAATWLHPEPAWEAGIHPSAVVASSARIHSTVYIGPHCVVGDYTNIAASSYIGAGSVIGANVSIDEDCRLRARVVIADGCKIGKRVLVQSGAVIGGDGFGFANDNGRWLKIPQIGGVIIGDDVEIGANTTIDRGALNDTVVEEGVKLDNQIQIGHNVRIGAHTAIAGCVGVAGSTVIGKHCAIAGKVGVSGHLTIVDKVTVTGGSIVLRSIMEPGVYSSGTPLQPERQWKRNFLQFPRLDEIVKRLKALERKFNR